jgi:hypothetical protein
MWKVAIKVTSVNSVPLRLPGYFMYIMVRCQYAVPQSHADNLAVIAIFPYLCFTWLSEVTSQHSFALSGSLWMINWKDLEGNSVACIWALSQCEGSEGYQSGQPSASILTSVVIIYLRIDLNLIHFYVIKVKFLVEFRRFLSFIVLNEKMSFAVAILFSCLLTFTVNSNFIFFITYYNS